MSGLNSDTRDGVGGLGIHCQSQRWCVGAAFVFSKSAVARSAATRRRLGAAAAFGAALAASGAAFRAAAALGAAFRAAAALGAAFRARCCLPRGRDDGVDEEPEEDEPDGQGSISQRTLGPTGTLAPPCRNGRKSRNPQTGGKYSTGSCWWGGGTPLHAQLLFQWNSCGTPGACPLSLLTAAMPSARQVAQERRARGGGGRRGRSGGWPCRRSGGGTSRHAFENTKQLLCGVLPAEQPTGTTCGVMHTCTSEHGASQTSMQSIMLVPGVVQRNLPGLISGLIST
eukprot:gene22846-biopygen4269